MVGFKVYAKKKLKFKFGNPTEYSSFASKIRLSSGEHQI